MMLSNRSDRVRGSLLGLAVGDALGAPLEGLSSQQIQGHYGLVTDYVDGVRAWRRKPHRWRQPGLYTDDTQQALILADCLLEHGRVVPEHLADAYRAMANPRGEHLGAHRGAGTSFRQVLDRLDAGTPIRDAAASSAGIGSAMRIAPLGIACEDRDELIQGVALASALTHRDARSLSGAAAVALAVRRILRMTSAEEKRPSFLLSLAGEVVAAEGQIFEVLGDSLTGHRYQHAVSGAIASAESVLDRRREDAYQELMAEANRQGAEPFCRRPTMGFPPALVPTCLYLFLVTESFEDALIEVVNLGGDADTAGAILGAIAGAYYGEAGIPRRWLDRLRNRAGIEAVADALAARESGAGPGLAGLIETERALSRAESNWRDDLLSDQSRAGGSDLGARRRT